MQRWLRRRVSMAIGAVILAGAGCAAPMDGAPATDEATGQAAEPLTISACSESAILAAVSPGARDFVNRALNWVHRGLPYCQCVESGSDGYRADCSGLVSLAWGLPTPGNTTYSFAGGPWDNHRSVRLGSWNDLVIGDAVNFPGDPSAGTGHIRLFAGWLNDAHTQYCSIEEYSTGHPAEIRSHAVDGSYLPIRLAGWSPCTPSPEVCDGQDNDCNGQVDEGDVCDVALLVRNVEAYAPPRSTDVDGDHHAEPCGRGGAGFFCRVLSPDGHGQNTTYAPLTDALGWDQPQFYSTIRMGDVDGDGRADVCARGVDGFFCWLATDGGFAQEPLHGPALSDAQGWSLPQYYTTIRLADYDGDGRADVCARGVDGLFCWASTGGGFADTPAQLDAWSDANSFDHAAYYGTIRMGDVNGDGRDDACVRTNASVDCWLSDGHGFSQHVTGPGWSDAGGWNQRTYWSSIRLADVNGDRRADLCARGAAGLYCALAQDGGFADAVQVTDAWSDAMGWDDAANYETIRVGDVDGDGAADLCARADAGIVCWHWTGGGFAQLTGPAFSDANGWNQVQFYGTLALGDYDGDGHAEACGRGVEGWSCGPVDGVGATVLFAGEFRDDQGWNAPQYYTTMRFSGPLPRPVSTEPDGGVAPVDGGASVADGGSSVVDGGRLPDGARAGDGGARPGDAGGCQCAATTTSRTSAATWTLAALALGCAARRRRRSSGRLSSTRRERQ